METHVLDRIDRIIKGDRLFKLFDMELVDSAEGHARIRAEVKDSFTNAHGIAHGAMIFALIDVAFAISVNARIDAVGIQWSFNIFRSTSPGDVILAESRLVHTGRSLMVVEFSAVSEKTGKTIAQGMATALPLPANA